MDNKEILEKLKFGIGDGNLQYYLYNWKCPYMECEKVCFVFMFVVYLLFYLLSEFEIVVGGGGGWG